MSKKLIFSLFLLGLLTGGCQLKSNNPIGGAKACTMEAKICPDGSSVGRSGPNCEFAPCPAAKTGLANPASTYCVNQGGQSVIVNNPDGSQGGNCVLKNGKTCEEWAYFRGTCQ